MSIDMVEELTRSANSIFGLTQSGPVWDWL